MTVESEVREVGGVMAKTAAGVGCLVFKEGETKIHLERFYADISLTPAQARKVSRILNKMAGRIEKRQA